MIAPQIIRELPKMQSDGCTHATVDPISGNITSYGVMTVDVILAPGHSSSAMSYMVERVTSEQGVEV